MEIQKYIDMLEAILYKPSINIEEKVKDFQDIVWDDETIENELLDDILGTLAYDLDFYEPSEKYRRQSASYYDDEHLLEVISGGLEKLRAYQKNNQ